MSSALANVLRANRTPILQQWQRRVAAMTQASGISRIELLDDMPSFVESLIIVFERHAGSGSGGRADEASVQETAPLHGAQRLRLGFDVDEVVREYGILADVLLATLHDADATIAHEEQRRLVTLVNTGAAEAVREYVRRRDEELARTQSRHRAFVAHELRTPLSTAVAASQLLGVASPELRAGRPLQLLERSLAKVRDLIDQVLVAGRLDAGVELERADVDVATMVREIEDVLRPEADGRDVTVTVVAPPSASVDADARVLYSALANLMRNAVKYTERGSTVKVVVRDEPESLVVDVVDGCGGITDENWATIFEPYARGDEGARRQRDGLGLGLAIAKQAAEAHGGTLAVRNVDADGCVFELRLPRTVAPAD